MKLPTILKCRKLNLRPIEEKDFDGFCSFLQSERATKHLLFQKTDLGSVQEITHNFRRLLDSKDSRDSYFVLVIADKHTDEYIGLVGLAPDYNSDALQIYWSVLPEYWNQGYASDAVKKVISYAFEKLNVYRIVAYSHPDNLASTKVAIKAGMSHSGTIEIDESEGFVEYFEIENL